MYNERLQEIKEDLETTIETHLAEKYVRWVKLYARDLIAALEASQQQLAEAQEDAEMQHKIHVMLIEDAVSKYEASQAEVALGWHTAGNCKGK